MNVKGYVVAVLYTHCGPMMMVHIMSLMLVDINSLQGFSTNWLASDESLKQYFDTLNFNFQPQRNLNQSEQPHQLKPNLPGSTMMSGRFQSKLT